MMNNRKSGALSFQAMMDGTGGDLKGIWGELLKEVQISQEMSYRIADEGYYLVAMPGATIRSDQSLLTAFHECLRHLPKLATGRLVRLEKLDSYGIPVRDNYRVWASGFASEIDDGVLHAGVFVDVSSLRRRLYRELRWQGLDYEEHAAGVSIISEPFRQWLNVFRVIVEMVMSARRIDDVIHQTIQNARRQIELYEEYLYRLAAFFPSHYLGIEDHHFALWDGQSQTAVGINYWGLGDTREEMEHGFLESVMMAKTLLAQVQEPVLCN